MMTGAWRHGCAYDMETRLDGTAAQLGVVGRDM